MAQRLKSIFEVIFLGIAVIAILIALLVVADHCSKDSNKKMCEEFFEAFDD